MIIDITSVQTGVLSKALDTQTRAWEARLEVVNGMIAGEPRMNGNSRRARTVNDWHAERDSLVLIIAEANSIKEKLLTSE